MIRLIQAPSGSPNFCFELIDAETGDSLHFVHSDWDYAGLASTLGWRPCPCGRTDGTVDCPKCGLTVSEMLSEAFDFLTERDGETFDLEWEQ